MNLYFVDKEQKEHLVKENMEAEYMGGNVVDAVLEDLKKRLPEFNSYYQRTWWDNYFRFWIDFGSHSEFYVLQDEKMVLNGA